MGTTNVTGATDTMGAPPAAPCIAPPDAGVAPPQVSPLPAAPARPALPERRWVVLVPYATFAILALVLGTARLATGPWFHVYNPREVRLMDGWPVSWEATYYTDHLPTFTSAVPPGFGISGVHYRTLLPLFLVAQVYAWTGMAYWAFAAVDLLFWCLAGIATFHLALRLGARPWAAGLSGLVATASPVLVSHMWRHDLHVVDFASL